MQRRIAGPQTYPFDRLALPVGHHPGHRVEVAVSASPHPLAPTSPNPRAISPPSLISASLIYDGATVRTAQTTLTDTIVADAPGPFDLASDKPLATAGAANLGTATADASRFDLVRTMIPSAAGASLARR